MSRIDASEVDAFVSARSDVMSLFAPLAAAPSVVLTAAALSSSRMLLPNDVRSVSAAEPEPVK